MSYEEFKKLYPIRNTLRIAIYVRKSRADIEQEKKAAERGESYDTLKRHRNELLRFAKRYAKIGMREYL